MGKNYCIVRNERYLPNSFTACERHNERRQESYRTNPDIDPSRSHLNVHFKSPCDSYLEDFENLVNSGQISLRGLRSDAYLFDELCFDVNSNYFETRGGYEFAKVFFSEAYKMAVQEVGGETYIISAVMHADEKNVALSAQTPSNVIYHYHLHVVYIPVVEKTIVWSKRCKDPKLIGTTKKTVMQVSHSKRWAREPVLDENANPVYDINGKRLTQSPYVSLQDRFYNYMVAAGFDDLERGQHQSDAKHLTTLEYKIKMDRERIAQLNQTISEKEHTLSELDAGISERKRLQMTHDQIDMLGRTTLFGKTELEPSEIGWLRDLAKEAVVSRDVIEKQKAELEKKEEELTVINAAYEVLQEQLRPVIEAIRKVPQKVKKFLMSLEEDEKKERERVAPCENIEKESERER